MKISNHNNIMMLTNEKDFEQLDIDNALCINAGPVCVINNKTYRANDGTKFTSIDDVKKFFSINTSIHLVYAQPKSSLFELNKIEIPVGSTIEITTPIGIKQKIEIDQNVYIEKKYYDVIIIRFYELDNKVSDNFNDCQEINTCIIKKIENNLLNCAENIDCEPS